VGTTKKERHLIVFLKYDVFLEPAIKEINIISKVERKKTYKKNEMIKYHNLFNYAFFSNSSYSYDEQTNECLFTIR
jgi:ribosomal protein S8